MPALVANDGTELAYHVRGARRRDRRQQPTPGVLAQFAALFPDATITTQPGAAHFPWLDDPTRFTKTITSFLARIPDAERPQ